MYADKFLASALMAAFVGYALCRADQGLDLPIHSITSAEALDFSRGRKRGPHGLTY